MGRVTLNLNGKAYVLGCDDGREPHLEALGARVAEKLRMIAPDAGAPGEARLILMAALMIADDVHTAETAARGAEARAADLQRTLDGLEAKISLALDAIADRLETMAPDSTSGQLLLL